MSIGVDLRKEWARYDMSAILAERSRNGWLVDGALRRWMDGYTRMGTAAGSRSMDDGVHESHGLDIWAVWIWRTGVLHFIIIWANGLRSRFLHSLVRDWA